jgi:hypothetical protein
VTVAALVNTTHGGTNRANSATRGAQGGRKSQISSVSVGRSGANRNHHQICNSHNVELQTAVRASPKISRAQVSCTTRRIPCSTSFVNRRFQPPLPYPERPVFPL